MNNEGQILRDYLDNLGLHDAQICRKLKVVRNTLKDWTEREKLLPQQLEKIAIAFPDAIRLFPERKWGSLQPMIQKASEPNAFYGTSYSPDCAQCYADLKQWQDRYITLLDDYHTLTREHMELLKKRN